MKQIFVKLFNSLLELFYFVLSHLKLKLIILICTIFYLIFFRSFAFFSYKAYLMALSELTKIKSYFMATDISHLISNFPLLKGENHIQLISNETIKNIYSINGFSNYKEFIYPSQLGNNDVNILHKMLNYEPELASRYSSFIIQDIINEHTREVADLAEHLIKRLFKYSLPLAGLVVSLTILNITNFDSICTLFS